MDAMDDSDLVYRALQGDQIAANTLFHRYYPNIFRYFKMRMWDQDVAQDLAQETFLKAWKNLTQVHTNFGGWLHTIAFSVLGDYLRRKRSSLPSSPLPLEFEREGEPFSVEEYILVMDTIQEELRKMPIKEQECIKLTTVEQLTVEEIAERLKLTVGTVRTYISSGRNRLRKAIFLTEEK
jgi:RNA polymerase sigma factor (sigma-70 family)